MKTVFRKSFERDLFPMSTHQAVTFQEALGHRRVTTPSQQETLVAVVRHRLMEHTRDVLSKHIEEARQELGRGEVRRGTVDELMKELSNDNAQMG